MKIVYTVWFLSISSVKTKNSLIEILEIEFLVNENLANYGSSL